MAANGVTSCLPSVGIEIEGKIGRNRIRERWNLGAFGEGFQKCRFKNKRDLQI